MQSDKTPTSPRPFNVMEDGPDIRSTASPGRGFALPAAIASRMSSFQHQSWKSGRSYSVACATLALALPLMLFLAFSTLEGSLMEPELSVVETKMLTKDENVVIHSSENIGSKIHGAGNLESEDNEAATAQANLQVSKEDVEDPLPSLGEGETEQVEEEAGIEEEEAGIEEEEAGEAEGEAEVEEEVEGEVESRDAEAEVAGEVEEGEETEHSRVHIRGTRETANTENIVEPSQTEQVDEDGAGVENADPAQEGEDSVAARRLLRDVGSRDSERSSWLIPTQSGVVEQLSSGMEESEEGQVSRSIGREVLGLGLQNSKECAALFTGPDCQEAKPVPECVLSPFRGNLTLSSRGLHKRQLQKRFGVLNQDDIKRLPEFDYMGDHAGPIGTCALVTSGASILDSGFGPQIDNFDVIMRLNNAPAGKKFAKDVGSRTDLRYTNGFYEASRDRKEEAVIAGKWCPKGVPCKREDLHRVLDKKAHPLNPDFLMHIKTKYFTRVHHLPSAGYVALIMLLHSCTKVHLYGFHVMAEKKAGGHNMKNWYYLDKLWHRPDLDKHRPSDKEMYQNKKWKVKNWTYGGDHMKLVKNRPSSEKMGEASNSRLPQLNTNVQETLATDPRPPNSNPLVAVVPGATRRRRRLLAKSQSHTIMVEKQCLKDLYTMGLLDATDP